MALCEGRFTEKSYDSLAEGKVRGTLLYVAQAFCQNNHQSPIMDEDDKLGRVLSCQFRVFKNKYPKTIPQKALPIGVMQILGGQTSKKKKDSGSKT
eukprot:8382739-Ditylum_brightwellii.AAC.1